MAVVLMHSCLSNRHEKLIGELAKQIGFRHVVLSSHIPYKRIVERGSTTVVEAYLGQCVQDYMKHFMDKFDIRKCSIAFMQSDGGLVRPHKFTGVPAVMSGPAGGYLGFSVTYHHPYNTAKKAVIGFDMGGTSTDVSRYDGEMTHIPVSTTAGRILVAPKL